MAFLSRLSNLAKSISPNLSNKIMIGPKEDPNKYIMYPNKILGSGAFGVVSKGIENKPDGRNVVIKKLINPFGFSDIETLFDREVSCLKKVQPLCETFDIICFIDAFEYENDYYIVTPLLDGYVTLQEFFLNKKYAINSDMATKIKKRLRTTIDEIHNTLNIRHTDLHEGNVMINPYDGIVFEGDIQIKIIDFGLCHFLPKKELDKQFVKHMEIKMLNKLFDKIDDKVYESQARVKPLRKEGPQKTDLPLTQYIIEEYKSPTKKSPSRRSKSPTKKSPSRRSKSPTKKSPSRRSKSPTKRRSSYDSYDFRFI